MYYAVKEAQEETNMTMLKQTQLNGSEIGRAVARCRYVVILELKRAG